MNASSNVRSLVIANKIASTASLFLKYFPDAKVNFSPWDNSYQNDLFDTLDFSFHFPGWRPSLECKAILLQLRMDNNDQNGMPILLGIVMKGMLLPKERWRVATIGKWEITGSYVPEKVQKDNLFLVCKELYKLFSTTSGSNKK
tara:strand:+ start:838 stop:1269 length:432 start_codon:yes stop_codon:yes gene_type:complete